MDKAEFLEILRSQLSGQMQEERIAAHLRYYQEYINGQMASGHSEEEILSQLGDPRLIAKTLLDTDTGAEDVFYQEGENVSQYEEDPYTDHSSSRIHGFHLDLTTWYGKVIVIAIAALIIFLLVVILGTILPVLIFISLILYLISKFYKNRR